MGRFSPGYGSGVSVGIGRLAPGYGSGVGVLEGSLSLGGAVGRQGIGAVAVMYGAVAVENGGIGFSPP